MTRNEVAVPETRQVSGGPEGLCPGLDGAPVASERVIRVPDSGGGLGGAEFLRWGRACVAALEGARAEIDGLNVFPVPDSDTGRNLLATMRAAVVEAEGVADTVDAAAESGAEGVAGVAPNRGDGGPPGSATPQAPEGGAAAKVDDIAWEQPGAVVAERRGVAGQPEEITGGPRCGGVEDESVGVSGKPGAGIAAGPSGNVGGSVAGVTTERPLTDAARDIVGETTDRRGRPVGRVHLYAAAMARGATSGARGNSGIILSQVLRGIAEPTVENGLTGESYREGLTRAAVLVRDSLSEPVEGTILTVLDRASGAARECPGPGLAEVARAAAEGAARALEQTRDQLAALRAAGVVDAGARGLLVLLDTMVAVVTGETPTRREYPPATHRLRAGRGQADPEPVRYEVMFRITAADDGRAAELRSRLARLGDSVVVAADGAGGWTAHVHCAAAGAAVEAGMGAGAVRDIRIEYLAASWAPADPSAAGRAGQVTAGPVGGGAAPGEVAAEDMTFDGGPAEHCACESSMVADDRRMATDGAGQGAVGRAVQADAAQVEMAGPGAQTDIADAIGVAGGGPGVQSRAAGVRTGGGDVRTAPEALRGAGGGPRSVAGGASVDRGVLAIAAGAGATGLFEAAGAVVLDAEPALESAALLAAIREMPHREVLVLPNGALPAHELVAVGVAARDAHRDVLLLPSASMVQGLAAMAVHDRARIAVDDAFAMSEAAAGTRWGALRRAGERALTMVGTCAPGDGLGLVGHDVVVIDRDTHAAGQTLLDRMLGLGGELVTLLVGADAPDGLAADLARHIGTEFPGVEVSVYSGGQRGDLIQIGVE
nr:DAK2 domain-containing protein [Nocardia carnea]